jgi:hypothetical protein
MQVPSTGGEPTVMIPPGDRTVTDWSRDGKYLLLRQGSLVMGPVDMYAAPADAPTHARPLLETSFVEYHARFSPDGRWVSYVSNESGRDEVYVMRFRPRCRHAPPHRRRSRPISTAGARHGGARTRLSVLPRRRPAGHGRADRRQGQTSLSIRGAAAW